MKREDPPARQPSGRKPRLRCKPQLKPVEVALHLLLSHPGEWFLVEHSPEPVRVATAAYASLRRRGCEVTNRTDGEGGHTVYARWPHPVPTDVQW